MPILLRFLPSRNGWFQMEVPEGYLGPQGEQKSAACWQQRGVAAITYAVDLGRENHYRGYLGIIRRKAMRMNKGISAGTKREAVDLLDEEVRTCARCRLADTRTHALCGEGPLDASLLLVALAPGPREDLSGRMFIGPSGPVLDRLLGAAGISREQVYMTNLTKCLLPKNRRPKMAEIEACYPFVEREIAIVRPRVVVPLGYYATRTILTAYHADPPPAREDFRPLYASLIVSDGQAIFPLPHPSFLLYRPALEPETIELYRGLAPFLCDSPAVL